MFHVQALPIVGHLLRQSNFASRASQLLPDIGLVLLVVAYVGLSASHVIMSLGEQWRRNHARAGLGVSETFNFRQWIPINRSRVSG